MLILFWVILLCSFGFQMLLWMGLWHGISSTKERSETIETVPPHISIIIPYKNEEVNLEQNLPSIINQNYPNYEVILINDHSDDQGVSVAQRFSSDYGHVSHFDLLEAQGKKHALTYGVGLARGEWLAFTDADCRPSDLWLASMIKNNQQADVVLGYGPYASQYGLLNKLIRYETWLIALQYIVASQYGLYYMAVGRNMLIKKNVFLQVNGFEEHFDLISGSDDLLMKSISKKSRVVRCVIDPKSYVYASPKSSLSSWYHQKSRHISTSIRYGAKAKLLLSSIAWSHILFDTLAVYYLFQETYFTYTLSLLIIRGATMIISSYFGMKKLKEKGLLQIIPLLDFLLALFYISLSFTLFFKPKKW